MSKKQQKKTKKKKKNVSQVKKSLKLTRKRLRFCEEYIIDLNGTKAAERAGYSTRSAQSTASYLLSIPIVKEKIDELLEERSKRTQITADMVVKEMARIAFSDMTDFAYWNGRGVALTDTDSIPEEKRACVAELSETTTKEGGSIRIKLHDKTKALDMLAKHLGMYAPEKHEHTGKDGDPIEHRMTYFPPKVESVDDWIKFCSRMDEELKKKKEASN